MQLVSSNQKVGPGLVDEDVGRLGGRYLRVTRLPWWNARAHGCNFSDDTISFSAVGLHMIPTTRHVLDRTCQPDSQTKD
jgi:hypothetical protein